MSDIAPSPSLPQPSFHLNIPVTVNSAIAPSISDLNTPSSIHPACTYAFITLFFFYIPSHLILYLALFVKIIHPIIHHIN